MNCSLLGKTALICGSTQGIGFATAMELAELGADCVLMARNETALQAAVALLPKQAGQQHNYRVADFDNTEEVEQCMAGLVNNFSVEILVNNSGGPAGGPITEAQPEQFLQTFNRHLICNHIITKAVIPSMKAAGYGRIINVISTSVKIPLPNLGVSNTIRGAVASWAKTMANELGMFQITVNNVLPGATLTQRLESILDQQSVRKGVAVATIAADMQQEIPLRRFAAASEIAQVIAFLASPAASYVTGTSIPVDGGRTGSI